MTLVIRATITIRAALANAGPPRGVARLPPRGAIVRRSRSVILLAVTRERRRRRNTMIVRGGRVSKIIRDGSVAGRRPDLPLGDTTSRVFTSTITTGAALVHHLSYPAVVLVLNAPLPPTLLRIPTSNPPSNRTLIPTLGTARRVSLNL